MKLYRFSPIKTEEDLYKAFEYIVTELKKLSEQVLDRQMAINTLKVFAHYHDEYRYLFELISKKGEDAPFNSETSHYSIVKENIAGENIEYLGVRVVDPYRLHVGCGDFEVDNFKDFENKVNLSGFIRKVDKEMIEIWHPDFDVLGYVVPKLN